MNISILRFDSINSTNIEAINQAKRGADEGLCVIAKQQTAGKGRHGRTWISPENSGIYFSIVLRPKMDMRFLPLLTFVGAIAVYELLIELYLLNPDIKWANDVHINDKKICGILAETVETNKGLAVIVGIGINLNSSNFPPELNEIATSIEDVTNQNPNYETILEMLIKQFSAFYEILISENGADKIRREWINRSSYAFGKEVKAVLENEIICGKTCGIEENGALRIEIENGEIITIQAGDVEKIRKIR
jgi:BirA family biotin operon repressor/biotin-[acetyl-CoA-carboxylase] ligase